LQRYTGLAVSGGAKVEQGSGFTVQGYFMGHIWGDENSHVRALHFYLIFIPLSGRKVSGVSVQDILFPLSFLTPET
jgi:hypothetical protein